MMSILLVTSPSLAEFVPTGPDRAAAGVPIPVPAQYPAAPQYPVTPQQPSPLPPAAAPRAAADAPPSVTEALDELRQFASASQLQVKFLKLPDGETPIYRLVKPETGEVIREFPPEHLTEILASLRAHARVDARA